MLLAHLFLVVRMGVTVEDAPICNSYKFETIDVLKALPYRAVLRQESRWTNAISFTVAVSDLRLAVSLLSPLSFVSEIEIVGRSVRPNDYLSVVSETTEESQESAINHNLKSKDEVEVGKERKDSSDTLALDYGASGSQLSRMGIPALHERGLNGSGVIISVLDTGFNHQHQSLERVKVADVYDFVYNDTDVRDMYYEEGASSHGTAAWSNIGAMAPGQLYGGSFGATYLLCKTEDTRSETSVEEDNFARAIEWSEERGADILSASLGYDSWHKWSDFDGKTSIIARTGNRAVDLGMLLIVANGNAAANGIGTPADMDRVLSLGALGASNDAMASFSSHGPTYDARIKPDVSAPGQGILVADFKNVGGYLTLSGTSFATPLTAGVAGLLLQSHPTWTNRQLRDAIVYSATPKGNPSVTFGFGAVNAVAADDFTPKTDEEIISLCFPPYGAWNDEKKECSCTGKYYGSDCRMEKLACRQWCPGLCSSPANDAECLCTPTNRRRCTRTSPTDSTAWTCARETYADGISCDCGCGLYDPDCDNAELPIRGCNSGETCSRDGYLSRCSGSPGFTPTVPNTPPSPPTQHQEPKGNQSPPSDKQHKTKYGIIISILMSIFALIAR